MVGVATGVPAGRLGGGRGLGVPRGRGGRETKGGEERAPGKGALGRDVGVGERVWFAFHQRSPSLPSLIPALSPQAGKGRADQPAAATARRVMTPTRWAR